MEEIVIPDHSRFIGETLASSGFRKETGVIIVGVKKLSGKMSFNPESHTKIEADDTMIVLGEPTAITKLDQLVRCSSCAEETIKKHQRPHE
jgi:voltage-gated potassium channel